MNLLIGEECRSKNCQIQENQQNEQSDIMQIRFWEQIAQGYQQEIQQLQQQLWENNLNKVFHKSNGVPKNFMDKIKRMKMGKSNKKCSICCNEFQKEEQILQLPCKHIFHENCCKSWLSNSRKYSRTDKEGSIMRQPSQIHGIKNIYLFSQLYNIALSKMSYMEILSMQKSFLDKNGISLDDYRNTFIRKTYTLLLLEYICFCGVSLLGKYIYQYEKQWIFWGLIIICQLCHFYFEYSASLAENQNKKIWNTLTSVIYLICGSFAFLFIWTLLGVNFEDQLWRIYLQIGGVILLLNFYSNMTSTHFQGEGIQYHIYPLIECWLIVLITPISIEFILNIFVGIYSPLFQTFVTMIITWLSSYMLQITQKYKLQKEFTFDDIQVLCCMLLGVQFQLLVGLTKSIIKNQNGQNDLSIGSYEIKLKYLKQISSFFSIIILILQISLMFGCGYQPQCFSHFLIKPKGEDYSFSALFWVSLAFSLILYPLILIFHRRINYIIKWVLVIIEIFFYSLILIGITSFMVMQEDNTTDDQSKTQLKEYLLCIALSMFTGIGIGFEAYSFIKKENIENKKAFVFMMICPIIIFISQIQFAIMQFQAIVITYLIGISCVFVAYAIIVLLELNWQLHKDSIDINAKEYQLGAMLIYQPIQTIIARICTLFI
ncbi:unnamed protein product (macronuclear) [Paramecium tetraurelia]|uniref:RING-type domain-containing protein n=1 Tax=Paramecium tetraurelia TaxID=5888 RepID=A0BYS1_PARTE|nr:uncharacterized protein GSPATT00033541001 [Paramecium tetraurelia]CAK63688.1 unnamed protein product [Paramecium tetraurelia]|eukprot:XP_001431086.1 hypothetical protein (macronuclear) [Paramecium tetraurelia strain d4-2]